MKLLKLEIGDLPKEKQFRSLHAGFKVEFHSLDTKGIKAMESFSPFCFAGLNGSGKSNVLEALAAIFFHMECCVAKYKPDSFFTHFRPHICSVDAFTLEYLIYRKGEKDHKKENFYKVTIKKTIGNPPILFRQLFPFSDSQKIEKESIIPPKQKRNQEPEPAPAKLYLPDIIVGYSSGENEILSIPFRKSRLMNFDKYRQDSIDNRPFEEPENSLIYVDAEMSQAVLLCCLLFEDEEALKPLKRELGIIGLQSFRININNYELHKLKGSNNTVKILNHCNVIIDQLKKCATCWNEDTLNILYPDNTNAKGLTLDFLVNLETKKVFKEYFKNSFDLFRFFQMLHELNLLSVDDEDKFEVYDSKGVYTDWKIPDSKPKSEVFTFLNYFILKKNEETEEPEARLMREISDGEHQFLHTMGICLMLKNRRSLLLLDEPETHFNPSWRAKFIKILNDSIKAGSINNNDKSNIHLLKDILLTSHSPFIISDCRPDNVILFKRGENGKIVPKKAKEMNFNTYGASVDLILHEIFGMSHSISEHALEEIRVLLRKRTVEPIIEGAKQFGESYEKGFLYERIEELEANKKEKGEKMIYPLTQVTGGIDKIYDVPLEFLTNAQLLKTCSDTLVPIWFKPVYNRCPGVKAKFETLFKAFKRLNKAKQSELISIYNTSKNIQNICSDLTNIYKGVDKYDKTIRKPLKSLFEFLFNETVGTAVFKTNAKMHIDDHYELFQKTNNVHVCPFCGLETYTVPIFRRAEYDHYLPISIYPWLGVNFNNLVPMGDHCNGKKNASNILYSDYATNSRRLVWYPYEWIKHSVVLTCKKKPTLADMSGEWEVVFKASAAKNQDKIKTWNDVFEIPLRFNEHIRTFHKRFIEDFAHKNKLKGQSLTITKLIDELKDYRDNGIGDVRLETMAQLKSIWADYHIKTKDKSQLALLVHSIAHQTARVKP